ncbi:exodeoxyribonuclease V subunit beta [Veronia nyctiphanis]|uniref:RecBCD enzyme subunit RecB n=1 Tax=Veronia nyctiphanis TaxID=1278244 RepID=A0A4V1LSQ7_9GAMM|nr:exodeoxyribonuclease V subunit beta [Veronia nyctiphanis]RXJ72538.1 exodeoxyribonuclease V subunit beta [Veronia nyctiphanis]
MSVQKLEPITFPLHGQRLIEASAGTGKTFTIAGLYLRLLLGHGADGNAHQQPLSVDQILVVTFTEAATQELRDRIRARIHDARLAFSRGESHDPVIAPLLSDLPDHKQAVSRLLQAERQMDEASVYTIHGFCQRMLTQNAFESGSLFSNEFVTDESRLRQNAVSDFWRKQFYPLDKTLAGVVKSYWAAPEALLSKISPYLSGPIATIQAQPMPDSLTELHNTHLARIQAVKQSWLAASSEIEGLLASSGVDKRSYSKRYAPKWLAEVTNWAEKETVDYRLPDALEKFSAALLAEKTKKGEVPTHSVFIDIERLLDKPPTLEDALLAESIKEVRRLLVLEKRRHGWLSFDDLLSQLAAALDSDAGERLAERIRELYPVAMIDEFQDTDPQQYRIFERIYRDSPESGLFMIGDPKQAIYAFRGADIFTYIFARRQVTEHYNLGTNWRSTKGMVECVNRVFDYASEPFIYDQDIPFEPVSYSQGADTKYWQLGGDIQPAMTFWLSVSHDLQSKGDYQSSMAHATAAKIRQILEASDTESAFLCKGEDKKAIRAGDIAILVRTGSEAMMVREAMNRQGIASVYLSNRNSVFNSQLAVDIERLLVAVLTPDNERSLRACLASSLFALTAADIHELNQNERAWEQAVAEFSGYRDTWFARGVLPMLRQMMQHRKIAERLLAEESGERQLTDLMHLGELLQQASQTLDSHHGLIRWLSEHIAEPNGNSEEQQVRLESERDLVQIVTIHKSKGLEYDLVFLPFVCQHRVADQPLFHDENNQAILALDDTKNAVERADKERLAEDLRLIYVALTRSVYGCFIGLAPLKEGRKSSGDTSLHKAAIGYLIQKGEAGDGAGLRQAIDELANDQDAMTVVEPPKPLDGKYQPPVKFEEALEARQFGGFIRRNWRLTSYSGLVKQGSGHHSSMPEIAAFDYDATDDNTSVDESASVDIALSNERTIFTFPRGARPGTFLHTLFENVDFDDDMHSEDVAEMISQALAVENYDQEWIPILQTLLQDVVSKSLSQEGMMLGDVTDGDRLTEMEFVMPVEQFQSATVNRIIKEHDPLSAQAGDLGFDTASGMLKGFIDLVFCWQGRYYVLDWKSNYLGASHADYTREAIETAMIDHRYDFQYQIYSLALHRFLKQRIPDYDYETHFGGVYYLFVRGIEAKTDHGIFYCKPKKIMIEQLDEAMRQGGQHA